MPICNYEGDVIGVAQIINKTNDSKEFTAHDVEVFQRYLTFCGIGIQNAQLFEVSVLEYKRNQVGSLEYFWSILIDSNKKIIPGVTGSWYTSRICVSFEGI